MWYTAGAAWSPRRRGQPIARVVEGEVKVAGLDLAHLGGVASAGLEAVEWETLVEVKDGHPGFEGAADLFQAAVVDAVGHDAGQAVEELEGQRSVAQVGDRHLADQGGKGLAGEDEVEDAGLDGVGNVGGLELKLVHADAHEGLVTRTPGGKGLVEGGGTFGAPELQKGAKAGVGCRLVGFVGRLELDDGVVFVLNAKAGDGLAAIDVEGPQGGAERAGDAGQEAGEGAPGGIVLDDEAALVV